MKNYYVMTLFPEMIQTVAGESIIGRASKSGLINVEALNIRSYTKEKHGHVDDAPYGGGAGMLMQAQPVCDCFRALCERLGRKPRVLYMSPQGRTFTQAYAQELAQEDALVFLCGHYEGIDERALEILETENVSIGDYVLTGGELPALVMIDAVARLTRGVLNKEESHEIESFSDGLLEYPQYTRPEVYEGRRVPDILLSGHHANIEKWRHEQSLARTKSLRPELYDAYIAAHPEPVKKKRRRRVHAEAQQETVLSEMIMRKAEQPLSEENPKPEP